jgi:hypothetical protein
VSSQRSKLKRVFGNRVVRRILGPERGKAKGHGKNYKMRNFIMCTP